MLKIKKSAESITLLDSDGSILCVVKENNYTIHKRNKFIGNIAVIGNKFMIEMCSEKSGYVKALSSIDLKQIAKHIDILNEQYQYDL